MASDSLQDQSPVLRESSGQSLGFVTLLAEQNIALLVPREDGEHNAVECMSVMCASPCMLSSSERFMVHFSF